MERCTVCNCTSAALHHHHVIPQAFGGVDGPQVPLCGDCHTSIHAHALALLAFKRSGGKSKVKQFWQTEDLEQRALPLVSKIVEAALNYSGSKEYKMVCALDTETYNCLKFLKKDLGQTSLDAALKYLIKYVYEQKHGAKLQKTNIRGW